MCFYSFIAAISMNCLFHWWATHIFMRPLWFLSLFCIKKGIIVVITTQELPLLFLITIAAIMWCIYLFIYFSVGSTLFHLNNIWIWPSEALMAGFPVSPLHCWKHHVTRRQSQTQSKSVWVRLPELDTQNKANVTDIYEANCVRMIYGAVDIWWELNSYLWKYLVEGN